MSAGRIMGEKLIFFDFDGTLVGNSRQLTPANKEAILELKRQGHKIFLCSGRTAAYLKAGIGKEIDFDGMIGCAGGCALVGDEVIYQHAIPLDIVKKTLAILESVGGIFQLQTVEGVFEYERTELFMKEHFLKAGWTEEQGAGFDAEVKRDFDNGVNHFINKEEVEALLPYVQTVVFMTEDVDGFRKNETELSKYYDINHFGNFEDFICGEMIPRDCSKREGIQKIAEHFGKSVEDTVGFGDSMNDLTMIEFVGSGYVFEGADERLLRAAKYTFPDPDVDGLARVIYETGLLKTGDGSMSPLSENSKNGDREPSPVSLKKEGF